MAEVIQIEHFITLSANHPVIDVRAPSEFSQGHIPGALNIPLFDDQERKVVGTAYKQVNKEAAMYAGLDFAGKKLVELAKEGEKSAGRKRHCWFTAGEEACEAKAWSGCSKPWELTVICWKEAINPTGISFLRDLNYP